MSVWDRATIEEKYAALCVLFGVLYLAVRQEAHETTDWKRRRQRDSLTLEEEALARLERGEALELPRWHGDDLELRAASTDAATSDRRRRRERPDTADRGRRRPATSGQDGAGDDQEDATDGED